MSLSGKSLYQPWVESEFCSDIDVMHMTSMERWMYRTLLQSAWVCSTRPYLPFDHKKLWQLAGCQNLAEWKTNCDTVLQKFTKVSIGGKKMLAQKRVISDLERETAYSAKLSEKQRDIANKRWNKSTNQKDASGMPVVCHGIPDYATELDCTELNCTELNRTELMTLKNKIINTSLQLLNRKVKINDPSWGEMKPLAEVYGQDAVADKFTEWANDQIHSSPSHPLTAFLKVANDLLRGSLILSSSSDTKELLGQIAFVSQGAIVPDNKQSIIIAGWLADYAPEEILTAFRVFYDGLNQADDKQVKYAMHSFTQKGPLLIDVVRRNKADAKQQSEVRLQLEKELAAKAATRLANIKPDEVGVDEDELFAN